MEDHSYRNIIAALAIILFLTSFVSPAYASPDFELYVANPAAVDTSHPSVATITVTAVYGFTSTVALSAAQTASLSCGQISPASITGSGAATISCNATKPGLYNVTIAGDSGSIHHTAQFYANFTAAPPPAPTILGLAVPIFYGIVAGIIAVAAITAVLTIRRRRKIQAQKPPTIKK